MPSQKVTVHWGHHALYLIPRFQYFFEKDLFVDMSLECNGKIIKAHRCVLAASSRLFEGALTYHNNISIVGVKYEYLCSLIQFIYSGKTVIPRESLRSVLKLAKFLDVKGLSSITVESVNGAFVKESLHEMGGNGDENIKVYKQSPINDEKTEIPVRIKFSLENAAAYVSGENRTDEGKRKAKEIVEEQLEYLRKNPNVNSTNQSLHSQNWRPFKMFISRKGERKLYFNNPSENHADVKVLPKEIKVYRNKNRFRLDHGDFKELPRSIQVYRSIIGFKNDHPYYRRNIPDFVTFQ